MNKTKNDKRNSTRYKNNKQKTQIKKAKDHTHKTANIK